MGIQGSKQTCVKALSCGSGVAPSQTVVRAELWATTVPTMPNLIESPPDYAFWCFPHASPVSTSGAGKQEAAPDDRFKPLISLSKFGVGEGIRTLDPNLGKVGNRTAIRSHIWPQAMAIGRRGAASREESTPCAPTDSKEKHNGRVHCMHTLSIKILKYINFRSSPSSGPRKSVRYRVETWRSYREGAPNCRRRCCGAWSRGIQATKPHFEGDRIFS
jgi:hypothetical protein